LLILVILGSWAEAAGTVGGDRLAAAGIVVDAAAPPLPSLAASSWLVADLDSGEVLAARNAHARHRPASTLKTLTALTVLPRIAATQEITVTRAELALTVQADGRSTTVGLEAGRSYPAAQLLQSMLALSANDAAEALVGSFPGGRPAALQAMNATARALQAGDTWAASPDGLDAPGQLSSAYDLALIARAALRLPAFVGYDTVRRVQLPSSHGPIGGANHNRLLNSYPGTLAGKDGFTSKAGQVWWGAAQRGGHRLVVTLMDAGPRPVGQQIALLDWGFRAEPTLRPIGRLVEPVAEPSSATVPTTALPGSATRPAALAARHSDGPTTGTSWLLRAAAAAAGLILCLRRLKARRRRGSVALGGTAHPSAARRPGRQTP
jgi:D-alanyl-D-alanine carboxypeptidase (penicillin-binding protein 5/6)